MYFVDTCLSNRSHLPYTLTPTASSPTDVTSPATTSRFQPPASLVPPGPPTLTHDPEATQPAATDPVPALVVFDLDYTLWPFWVDTHVSAPVRPADAARSAAVDGLGERLAFYDDVPAVLAALPRAGVRLAVASRTAAPDLARRLLQTLHLPSSPSPDAREKQQQLLLLPQPMRRRAIDVFDAGLEMYPGSKLRHFEALRRRTGVPFEDMLFFDDESRNRETERLGLTMCLARDGLTWAEVERGVDEWRRRRGRGGCARDAT